MFSAKKAFRFWLLSTALFGLATGSGFILDNYFPDDTVFNIILPFMLLFLTATVWLIMMGYRLVRNYAAAAALRLRERILKIKK